MMTYKDSIETLQKLRAQSQNFNCNTVAVWLTTNAVSNAREKYINFDQELNAAENLELHARLFRMEKIERQRRIKELLDYMEISDFANESVRKLSGGMKK